MFDFKGITHVIENPKGHALGYNYSLVGAVPLSMLEARKPTTSDVMGGRVQSDGFAYGGRKWQDVESIIETARKVGAHLCTSPTCACRSLFWPVSHEGDHAFTPSAENHLYCESCGASETDHAF